MNTPIATMTETEILSAIRDLFPGRHVAALKLQPLIDQSTTLQDLYIAVVNALNNLENSSNSTASHDLMEVDSLNSFSLPDNYCTKQYSDKTVFTNSVRYPARFHGQTFDTYEQLFEYLEKYCATREDGKHLRPVRRDDY